MTASSTSHPVVTEAQLKEHLQGGQGRRGVALDIDETLSWTVGHWMQEMLQLFGNPEDLTPQQMADKYRLCQLVPYWGGRPEVEEWMHARRVDDDLQTRLPLVAGAQEGVARLAAVVPVVAYITTRPQAVLDGTRHWLRKHGFPDAPLLGKPDDVPFEQANVWKGTLLPRLLPHVAGLVDDNPAVLKAVPEGYNGRVFWFCGDGPHVEVVAAAAPGAHAVLCPTWLDVANAVIRELQTPDETQARDAESISLGMNSELESTD